MNNFIADLKEYFSDRVGSPIWVSITVSWLLYNWEFTIRLIFHTNDFTVGFVKLYLEENSWGKLIFIPVMIGFLFVVFSPAIKETTSLFANLLRSLIAMIDRREYFYKSISIEEHENRLRRLKNRSDRLEKEKLDVEIWRDTASKFELESKKLTEEKRNIEDVLYEFVVDDEALPYSLRSEFLVKLQKIGYLQNVSIGNLSSEKESSKLVLNSDQYVTKEKNIGFYKKVERVMPLDERNLLGDPNSNINIFLVLLMYQNPVFYTNSPSWSRYGIPESIYKGTQSTLLNSKMLIRKGNAVELSELGRQTLNKYLNGNTYPYVNKLLDAEFNSLKNELFSMLLEKSMTTQDIAKELDFYPNIGKLVDSLLDEKLIIKSGPYYMRRD